jgi:hypothetical protein
VARYGQAYKDRIVARLLPPESSAVEVVSREVGVSMATLERRRGEARPTDLAVAANAGQRLRDRKQSSQLQRWMRQHAPPWHPPVPSCLVEDHGGMARDLACNHVEMQLHRLAVADRQHSAAPVPCSGQTAPNR